MSYDNRPIGIFDSGLGGLTVVAALSRRLPHEQLIYLGDTARVPYGSKSRDTVVRFALDDARFLREREVKAIIVACNTVSALAMEALTDAFPDLPLLGVVEAGVDLALNGAGAQDRLVVTGTAATVRSDRYRVLIQRRQPGISVASIACPLFVPLVEEGCVSGDLAELVARRYLGHLFAEPPDRLILGCTHYPLLKGLIAGLLPDSVALVDSAEACAVAAEGFLAARGLTASPANSPRRQFFVTDMPASFFALATRFLGEPLAEVDKVTVGA